MTPFEFEEINTRLDRIEAKLDRLLAPPLPDILTVREAMKMTGFRSIPSFYRALPVLGLRSYMKGKYRRSEVENAIARRSLSMRLQVSRKTD